MTQKNALPLARVIAMAAMLGLGAGLTSCADIHPAPDDPGGGIIDPSQGEQENIDEERMEEEGRGEGGGGEEGGGRR